MRVHRYLLNEFVRCLAKNEAGALTCVRAPLSIGLAGDRLSHCGLAAVTACFSRFFFNCALTALGRVGGASEAPFSG